MPRTAPPHQIQKKKDKQKSNLPLLIDSGCSVLNCCCSDYIHGAWVPGTIVTLPGGTDSGKTVLVLSTLALAANNPLLKNHSLFYDDVESKMRINIRKCFNAKAAANIKPPPLGKSITVEDFENNIVQLLQKEKKSIIYVLDTPDSLSTGEETDTTYKNMIKSAKSADDIVKLKGYQYAEKAKVLHRIFREINDDLEATKSLLIMVQQVKQKMNAMQFERKEYTSGGNAPAHVSIHRPWMSRKGNIKSEDKTEKVGIRTYVDLVKNHYTGKLRSCEFDIYYDLKGMIDDIACTVDWLCDKGEWKKKGSWINATELDVKLQRNDLINFIEENEKEEELRSILQRHWNDREESLRLKRKGRF